ncbi:glutaredoxin domain-containing protein [Dechloromonas sp. CZR5]|uniref:glutaredoxin domain-containing protein n=1 Tax=Dechloromonas sp. CZR5 TaxID=2608630 RepID=UPI00123D059C|nr:glutaredoxin domain-containing protein [Dechloromonas sp. CZR5]
MSRICPHCNHARKADDNVPEWQCPACGKAYDKAGSHLPPRGLRTYGPNVQPAGRSGGIRWLLILVALGAAFWFGRPLLLPGAAPIAAASASQPEVSLYATEWCGYCKLTREFFAANGIRYTEYDIEKSSEALKQHRKLGGNGVPLIVIGDDVINGWNEERLHQLLRPWVKG